MIKNQSKINWIIWLILAVFFIKGVFLTALFPIFKGQDESRHYNSIQFLNEPKEKTWETVNKTKDEQNKQFLNTYRYSEEIQKTAEMTGSDVIRSPKDYEKISFTDSFLGENEAEINEMKWDPLNKTYPPDVVKGSLYHKIGAVIENSLSDQNIFVRYFSLRIFSVLLGAIAVFLFYLIVKNVGFTQKQSLLMTAILSFQPKFSTYLTNINYDALLILAFFLFTFSGILILKKGFDWKNTTLIILSAAVALLTKGTGLMLIPVFLGLIIYQLRNFKNNRRFRIYVLTLLLLCITALLTLNYKYNLTGLVSLDNAKSFDETTASLGKYLSDIFLSVPSPDGSYWGDLGWVRDDYSGYFVNVIWAVQLVAILGLILAIFLRKKLDFLPERKYLVFLFGIWLSLQFGIRFFDWKYSLSDPSLPLGTPGRYFLPAIASHLILIFAGLGIILRKEKNLDIAMKVFLILIFAFFMHSVFNIIIPYFYL